MIKFVLFYDRLYIWLNNYIIKENMAVDSTDYKSEAKILGLVPYGKGIAWIIGMIVLAVLFVLFTFEEPELYSGYFIIAGFNMCCLGVTYYMRQ